MQRIVPLLAQVIDADHDGAIFWAAQNPSSGQHVAYTSPFFASNFPQDRVRPTAHEHLFVVDVGTNIDDNVGLIRWLVGPHNLPRAAGSPPMVVPRGVGVCCGPYPQWVPELRNGVQAYRNAYPLDAVDTYTGLPFRNGSEVVSTLPPPCNGHAVLPEAVYPYAFLAAILAKFLAEARPRVSLAQGTLHSDTTAGARWYVPKTRLFTYLKQEGTVAYVQYAQAAFWDQRGCEVRQQRVWLSPEMHSELLAEMCRRGEAGEAPEVLPGHAAEGASEASQADTGRRRSTRANKPAMRKRKRGSSPEVLPAPQGQGKCATRVRTAHPFAMKQRHCYC